MNIQEKLGKRIKEVRAEVGLSQEYLAFLSNRDTSYLSDVELGKRNVSFVVITDIIKGLGVSVPYFFSGAIFK